MPEQRGWESIENVCADGVPDQPTDFIRSRHEGELGFDAFIEVVRIEPEAIELHFALGALFRRRGETERAIRVHENLVERGDLDGEQRAHALFELGQDFLKAGLLMALESSGARANQLANQILTYGRPVPLEEIVGKIEAVTADTTRAAGRALVARSKPAISALGPAKGLEAAASIVQGLSLRAA